MAYERYISSDGWRAHRDAKLRLAPACEACGAREHLHVHHRTYERFGAERMGDLRTLCETCHAWVHHIERSGVALAEATDRVVSRRAVAPARQPRAACLGDVRRAVLAARREETLANNRRDRYGRRIASR